MYHTLYLFIHLSSALNLQLELLLAPDHDDVFDRFKFSVPSTRDPAPVVYGKLNVGWAAGMIAGRRDLSLPACRLAPPRHPFLKYLCC
jgi:hypothetical protein